MPHRVYPKLTHLYQSWCQTSYANWEFGGTFSEPKPHSCPTGDTWLKRGPLMKAWTDSGSRSLSKGENQTFLPKHRRNLDHLVEMRKNYREEEGQTLRKEVAAASIPTGEFDTWLRRCGRVSTDERKTSGLALKARGRYPVIGATRGGGTLSHCSDLEGMWSCPQPLPSPWLVLVSCKDLGRGQLLGPQCREHLAFSRVERRVGPGPRFRG